MPVQPVARVPAAFDRRCILRLAGLGATRGFTTGCVLLRRFLPVLFAALASWPMPGLTQEPVASIAERTAGMERLPGLLPCFVVLYIIGDFRIYLNVFVLLAIGCRLSEK